MPFNSFAFVLGFFPVVVVVNAILAEHTRREFAQFWLLAASVFFYGYYKPSNLAFLFGSIVFNWGAARLIGAANDEGRKSLILRGALTANVLYLCSFKYINFIAGALPAALHLTLPDWNFPLGISFFTLIQVMYLVDTRQGLNGPNSLIDHATLVSLFPYVISGPLVRSRMVVPQFHQWKLSEDRMNAICRGLYVFAIGLTKKVIFADAFATVADAGFSSPASLSTLEAWVATLAYAFQIYFDFSGYSDMAVGAARMLGIEIPQNFNAPYRAKSMSEFWQRWHITLSNFITNYLYTPLLRSMGTANLRTSAVATLLAMGIAGLWHGPSWTFILWGLWHGAGLSINQVWKRKKFGRMPDGLSWMLTFTYVTCGYVFFRSATLPAAMQMFGRMLPNYGVLLSFSTFGTVLPLTPWTLLRPVALGTVLAFWLPGTGQLEKNFQARPRLAFASAALFLTTFYFMNSAEAKPFLYFVF